MEDYELFRRIERRLAELESRLEQAERDARTARDDVYRLEGRLRDLEYSR